MRHRSTVVITGALAGGLLGIALLALFTGRFASGSVGLSSGGDAELVVRGGAVFLAAVVVALIGGAIVSTVAYGAIAGSNDDEATQFELAHIMPFGLVTAIVAGCSILRAGLGLTGDAADGNITTTVAALALSTLLASLVAGGATAWVVSILAAKSIVGLEGEAAPTSTGAMMRAATQAVMGPMLAIVIIAVLAIGLSQLLLAAEGDAAVAIFSGVAALVLLGATAAAYLGGGNDAAG